MKIIPTLATFTIVSLLVMVSVDYFLGERAEFLNAWSVVERLVGQTPSAGESVVFRQLGAVGETSVVLAINLVIGGVLTEVSRWWMEKRTHNA
jgi:hypothetical protein